MYLFSLILTSFVLSRVLGTLIPSGSVSIDCGGQRTFTCTVTGQAAWTVTGLMRIAATGSTAGSLAAVSARVNTTDTGLGPTSTITITEFCTNDNGGTVQCVDVGSGPPSVEGVVTIAVVPTTLASATAVMANVDQCSATLTWSEPSDSSVNTSVSCTPSSPQCSSCTSSGCTIGGLNSSTSYTFSVTRSRSGCDDSTAVSSAVMSGGPPQCGQVGVVIGNDSCPSFTFTPQGSVLPSTVVVSHQLVADPSSAGSLNCAYPVDSRACRLTTLPMGNYTFTLTPRNSCGLPPNACSSNTLALASDCNIAVDHPAANENDFEAIFGGAGGGIAGVALIGALAYGITIVIMRYTCYSYLGFLALLMCQCCPCCKGKARKSSSKQRIDSESPITPPAQPPAQPPADEYADPQAIRDRKESGKEDKDKIQYAAIDFSAGAGSGAGEVKIHQKEEPVIYTTVQHV